MSDSPTSPEDSILAQAELLRMAGRQATHIVDGGAFEGEITARYLDAFPNAHVWAFEPTPTQVDRLRSRFNSEPRVTVIPKAVGAVAGYSRLDLNDAPATNSLLPLDARSSAYLDYPVLTTGNVEVEVETLDGFCEREGLDAISIIKLDVQGLELEVVSGASDLLGRGAVDLFFTEVNFVHVYERQTRIWNLLQEMDRFGYSVFDLYGARRSPEGQLKWCDALFTSPSLRSAVGYENPGTGT